MSGAATFRGLAYEVKNRGVPGGGFKPHAVARCARCPAERAFRLPRESNNPEAVQLLFRGEGWQFDAWNAGQTRCPKCLQAAIVARRGESPKARGEVVMLRPDGPVPPGGATTLALPPNKTELTAAERARLRTLLDGVFDDAKGFYIEAYSDAKVAAETNLPEKLVRDYRDVAFGPLKSVPELDAINVDIRTLQERSAAHTKEATAIGAQVEALKRRVEETARRLGVKA